MMRGGERGFTLTQKTALLTIQARPLPDGAPGPLCNKLLSRSCEWSGVLHRIVDILMAEDSPTNLQPLCEESAVQFCELRICGGHYGQYVKIKRCEWVDG